MARTKKVVVATPTETEAQELLKCYAANASYLKKLEAEMELKIAKIRESYQPKADPLKSKMQEQFNRLEAYAIGNREAAFTKRKSLQWAHGTVGFRTGTPKVDKKKGITWQAVLELMKGNGLTAFIRTKEEIDKDRILSVREDAEQFAPLSALGLSVVQEETFYVEVKEENLTAV